MRGASKALRPATASTVSGSRHHDRFGGLISADAISQTQPELQPDAQAAPERERLSGFARPLRSRAVALRRDERGNWRMNGSRGHVHAAPEGFQILVMGWWANGWNRAKRVLLFAQICNDGDDEGGFVLDRFPPVMVVASVAATGFKIAGRLSKGASPTARSKTPTKSGCGLWLRPSCSTWTSGL
jgi:hypothetical protein